MLSVNNLSVVLGARRVLEDLSFDVGPRDIMVVAGGNGTGKSTLLRAIAGLLRPAKGSIECCGRSILGREPHLLRRDGLAYLPQHGCVFPELSVQENLRLPVLWAGPENIRAAEGDLLRQVYAESFDQRAGLLSRGQQQLLSVEMTLASEPKVLLLDEPFAPLSQRLRQLVADFVRHYTMSRGCATLVAEHDLETLAGISTRHIELDPPQTIN